jgi:hypothetical protein
VRRWWEIGERSLEDEIAWIREGGFEFEFDRALFEAHEVVVFRGHLRLGDKRSPAVLVYPPAYHTGEHPLVRAPQLAVGRHRAPDGTLCLIHDVFGDEVPMWGGEAIHRAERLWWLWVNDRNALHEEEADVPDPWANYVDHAPQTAITFMGIDVAGYTRGYFRTRLVTTEPMRGVVTQLRATAPAPMTIEPGPPAEILGGELEVNGAWMRIDAPPPDPRPQQIVYWLSKHCKGFIEKSVQNARADAEARKQTVPALLAFVYPDEGPRRGETHDAWLVAAVNDMGGWSFPRPVAFGRDDAWIRQPQFKLLSGKSAAFVGAGAIGSHVIDNCARAGVGTFVVIDKDYFSPGNRVRHVLDLQALGLWKASAVADRIRRINPWASVRPIGVQLGAATSALAPDLQRLHDRVVDEIAACDLIVNASAHSATGSYLSNVGAETGTPVVHCYVSGGAWGARVLVQRPGVSGCWDCLGLWQQDHAFAVSAGVEVPTVAEDPNPPANLEEGCADPVFTGSNFDLAEAAAATARVVMQELVEDTAIFPRTDFDLVTLNFRSEDAARTNVHYTRLPPHPDCRTCAT